MKLFISGYGGGATNSIGLYDMGADCKKEKLLWSSNVEASSYLSVHGDMLFGITEKGSGSSVYMFKEEEKYYRLMDSRELEGDVLCHISYLPQNRILVGSCYGSGDIFSIEVKKQEFGEVLGTLRQGNGSRAQTRAHCAVAHSDEGKLYSANIALDRIYIYDVRDGILVEDGYYQLDRGEGPRHILLYPELNLIYIITEYSNRIITLSMNKGRLKEIQSISTLEDDFSGKSFCSTLCMTGDKKYLYAANRGANTIGIFTVHEDGILEKVSDHDCFGDWPRHIALLDNDRYLGIANQNSNEVIIAKRDRETGFITEEIKKIDFYGAAFLAEKGAETHRTK